MPATVEETVLFALGYFWVTNDEGKWATLGYFSCVVGAMTGNSAAANMWQRHCFLMCCSTVCLSIFRLLTSILRHTTSLCVPVLGEF